MWIWLTLSSGVFNALWTARIKSRVQTEGALPFTVSMRWGVALCLLPLAILTWQPVSSRWWILSGLAGFLECLSLWAATRGMRKDYFSTYALANTTPLFIGFLAPWLLGEVITPSLWAGIFLVVAGAVWLYYRGHWSWWGLLAAWIGAFSSFCSKEVVASGSFSAHSCLAFSIGALIMTPLLFRKSQSGWRVLRRNIHQNKYLILLSALATVSFYWALQLAPLSRVSPLVRINLVVGFILSYYYLGERSGWKSRGFGAALILAGLILVVLR
jgi:drug/metabolite transporter (DMT)-like permease